MWVFPCCDVSGFPVQPKPKFFRDLENEYLYDEGLLGHLYMRFSMAVEYPGGLYLSSYLILTKILRSGCCYSHLIKWRNWDLKSFHSWVCDQVVLKLSLLTSLSLLFLLFQICLCDYFILFFTISFFKINFYWSLADLQCCVSFRCTAKWISYT